MNNVPIGSTIVYYAKVSVDGKTSTNVYDSNVQYTFDFHTKKLIKVEIV